MSLSAMPAQGATASVNIIDFAFNPAAVTIQVNDSVAWTWVGPTVHTTTSTTGLWDSGLMNASASKFTHTFTASGSYPYICSVHPFMTGSVTVTGQVQTNVPPTVSITSPADGSNFPAPWTGIIQASVGDSDGSVTQVVFMVGSTAIGTISNPSANPSVTASNLAAGSYTLTAVATDNAGTSTTSVGVHITVTGQTQTNSPPAIAITSPPDGATFAAPWTGTIEVVDADSDGTVTQIDFKANSTLLGTILNPSALASLVVSNLAAGDYLLTAIATDNGGASTTSTAVHIIVGTTNQPPGITNILVDSVSSITFDPQTGLFDQSVTVTNAGDSSAAGVRLSVLSLPKDVVLYDASGSTNGAPYVDYDQPLDPGASVAFLLEYYRSNRLDFVSTNFVAGAITPTAPPTPAGTLLQLDRHPFLSNGQLIIEFASKPGKTYVIEYSADMQSWNIAVPPITAGGTRVQWADTGPPKTQSAPVASAQRFYRVVQLP